ncbi:MAG TPA: DUF4149 domain-containing protein [Gemmatimonadales bacterium]
MTVGSLLYYATVTAHLLAALLWLGGMFFLAIVGAPVLRSVEPAALRQRLFHEVGLRFRALGWTALGVLLVTGVLNLQFRGWLHWGVLSDPAFWRTPTGLALGWKLAAVAMMLVVSVMHDFFVGPKAGRAAPGFAEGLRLRRRAAVLARLNALLGLVVVVAAVRLARGG